LGNKYPQHPFFETVLEFFKLFMLHFAAILLALTVISPLAEYLAEKEVKKLVEEIEKT